MNLLKSHPCPCSTCTHLGVVECSEPHFLFVYVYETAVKEGCVLMRRYMEVCSVYADGAHPYGPVFVHVGVESEGTRKRTKVRGRASHLYSP